MELIFFEILFIIFYAFKKHYTEKVGICRLHGLPKNPSPKKKENKKSGTNNLFH